MLFSSSYRIVQAFEVIVASIIQDENFDELLIEGNDVALLAERVSEPFHSQRVHILILLCKYM